MMRCEELRLELSRASEEDRSPSAEALEHLETCEECRKHRADLARLGSRLRADAGPTEGLRPELRARILEAVQQDGPAPARRLRRLLYRSAAVAAAACVVLALLTQTPREQRPRQRPPAREAAALADLGPPEDLGRSLVQAATKPLRREADRIVDDVRATGRGVLACLPLELIRSHWVTAGPADAAHPTSREAAEAGREGAS